MRRLMNTLQDLKIELYLMDIESSGYYLPNYRSIIANQLLSEHQLKQVILHELKHVVSHSDYILLYKTSFSYHSKMECEANEFMLKKVLYEYLDEFDVYPATVNAINFIESNGFDLNYESYVKKLLAQYTIRGKKTV